MKINIPKLKCARCGHEWYPKGPEVRICPKCKSAYWDKPRKERTVKLG
jgi:Zn finger protein HypA/HybF involved in hydrogenase expression